MFSLNLRGQTNKSKSSCLPTYKCYYYNYKSRLLLPAFFIFLLLFLLFIFNMQDKLNMLWNFEY